MWLRGGIRIAARSYQYMLAATIASHPSLALYVLESEQSLPRLGDNEPVIICFKADAMKPVRVIRIATKSKYDGDIVSCARCTRGALPVITAQHGHPGQCLVVATLFVLDGVTVSRKLCACASLCFFLSTGGART